MTWTAEISYRDGRPPVVVKFKTFKELDEIVEAGPPWRELEKILVTPNTPE